jgi:peptide/nickel transport system permease protein
MPGTRALAVAFGVSILAFALLEIAPGDPAEMIAIARYGAFGFTDQMVEKIREEEGLNSPFTIRYSRWVFRAIRGDFGNSIVRLTPVARELAPRARSTLALAGASMALTLLLALPLGIVPALLHGSLIGRVFLWCSAIAAALPAFWLGNLLILLFAVLLSWLPAAGDEGPSALVLPTVSIAIVQAPWAASLLRSAVLTTSRSTHVQAARARGVSALGILVRHQLFPALAPLIALLGIQFAWLLEGAVIVEIVFARPGLGRMVVEAVVARDFPVLLACVATIGAATAMVSACAALVQKWLDPRIRLAV